MESVMWEPPEYIEPEVTEPAVVVVAEIMPRFQGGEIRAFWKYIQTEITYPEEARRLGITGTVIVQFVVDENGYVSQVTLTRSADPYLDQEAVRAISSSPGGSQEFRPGNRCLFYFPYRLSSSLNTESLNKNKTIKKVNHENKTYIQTNDHTKGTGFIATPADDLLC